MYYFLHNNSFASCTYVLYYFAIFAIVNELLIIKNCVLARPNASARRNTQRSCGVVIIQAAWRGASAKKQLALSINR